MMRYRILVVEDHPLLLTDTTHILASLGTHRVDGVSNGGEALRLLNTTHYDLVVSDLHMPEVDGLSLIEQWPTLPHNPALALISAAPLAILSGVSQAAKTRGLPVLGVYSKPFTPRHANAVLQALKEHQRHAHALNQPCHTTHTKQQLQTALNTQAIHAWFQPQYSMRKKKVVGVEALARWQHPSLGLLSPGSFMHDIEQHALHETLLYNNVQQSIHAQQTWQKQGHELTVSINLHTSLLDDLTLPERLYQQVMDLHAKPAAICFELTEHSTTLDDSHYYSGATRLRMKGFTLSQDDFSNGYNSFQRLLSTPFNELKLDRSLLHNAFTKKHYQTALRSLLALGNDLELNVVAEGVETQQESAFLYALGCDVIQGFLVSPALPPHHLTALLSTLNNPDVLQP